jgi:hypothetical protein
MSSPQSPRALGPFCSTVPASQRLPAAGLGGPSPHQVAYLPLLPNEPGVGQRGPDREAAGPR